MKDARLPAVPDSAISISPADAPLPGGTSADTAAMTDSKDTPKDAPDAQPQDAPPMTFTDTGYLTVSAGTGGKAYPLPDTRVEIYLQEEDGEYRLFRVLQTDASGMARKVPLPTPQAEASQTPDSAFLPYTVARVRVYHPGYYAVEAREVPVFPGITSLQHFDMIPYAEDEAYREPAGDLVILSEHTENAL